LQKLLLFSILYYSIFKGACQGLERFLALIYFFPSENAKIARGRFLRLVLFFTQLNNFAKAKLAQSAI